MKLNKFQIIALVLILLGWYFQGGGLSPKFVPDLKAEEVEARGVSGLLTLVSLSNDLKPVPDPISFPDNQIEVPVEPEVQEVVKIAERKPRVILLTQSVGCAPCSRVHTNIVEALGKQVYLDVGWTTGPENTNPLQIIDFSTNESEFFSWVEKVNLKHNNKYRGGTPSFLRIDKDGEIESYIVGEISLDKFIKFQRGEK